MYVIPFIYTFVIPMNKGHQETIKVRIISVTFVVLALAIFKPFGLPVWQWETYLHLFNIGLLGLFSCFVTETILRFIVRMPRLYDQGVDYIIRRNLWFQCINTFLVSLMISLYRHFVLSSRLENNHLSWSNFLETLIIIGFCSFAIGLYWRYKFRSRYLAAELEETRQLNEQLARSQASEDITNPSETVTLTGSTTETVTLPVSSLLYIEAVGNYVKVYQWREEQLHNDMLRATTKQLEETLRPYTNIVRCHRAFLVNIGQVEHIISNAGTMQLVMKHGHDSIPVSRSNMSQIKEVIKIRS